MIPGKNPFENLIRGDFETLEVAPREPGWPVRITITGSKGSVTFELRGDVYDAFCDAIGPFLKEAEGKP